MNVHSELVQRNRTFAANFKGGLPILPKLRTVLVTCLDPRVDPAHVLGLELGDAVVIRNTGGRVTDSVIDEIATLAVMVNKATQGSESGFDVVLMQHTQCGAQQLADPQLQSTLREKLGIDVSAYAITDQPTDLRNDVQKLMCARTIPDAVSISALVYDVKSGQVEEILETKPLSQLRTSLANAAF